MLPVASLASRPSLAYQTEATSPFIIGQCVKYTHIDGNATTRIDIKERFYFTTLILHQLFTLQSHSLCDSFVLVRSMIYTQLNRFTEGKRLTNLRHLDMVNTKYWHYRSWAMVVDAGVFFSPASENLVIFTLKEGSAGIIV